MKAYQLYKKINEKFICPFCGYGFSKKGIGTHIWRSHTNEGRTFSAHNGHRKGIPPWNKGLTKETDIRVQKQADSNKKYAILNLKGKPGRKHSESVKKRLSKIRKNFLQKNPDKVPYRLNHSSKESYLERIFREALYLNDIKGWIQEYNIGLYRYDFAFPDLKIDVEIDGGTHNTKKVKNIDKRRDKWSKSQGWKVIRFTSHEIKNDINNCIDKLKLTINK